MKVVGLMSGTSLDGVDAALIDIDEAEGGVRWRLLGFDSLEYTRGRRDEIHDCILKGSAASLCQLHTQLGEWFADAVFRVCDTAGVDVRDVDLVGSHGQTVWHHPPSPTGRGATLQLGCPATIAERTGLDVVSDFRARDMAAGGEGAPLVPWVDRLLFAGDRVRVLQNIGGMANLTRVPPRGVDEPLVAFDTGPGNALIDTAVELATNGEQSFDRDGGRARLGAVDERLLARLLDDEFFRREPPKSTGREYFGRTYVQRLVEERRPADREAWSGLVATLTALTAHSIADAVRRWADPGEQGEVILTGGGSQNDTLVEMIQERLTPIPVRTGDALGIHSEAKEAVAFAALAWAHVRGRPGNVPEVTGASGPRVLGSFTPGSRA